MVVRFAAGADSSASCHVSIHATQSCKINLLLHHDGRHVSIKPATHLGAVRTHLSGLQEARRVVGTGLTRMQQHIEKTREWNGPDL